MITVIALWYLTIHHAYANIRPWGERDNIQRDTCLTGYMTDVQSWVNEFGTLTAYVDQRKAIDLTGRIDPIAILMKELQGPRRLNISTSVQYLSMSRCNLKRVPTIFRKQENTTGWDLSSTVEYLTMFGNNFSDMSAPGVQYAEIMNATNAQIFKPGFRRPGDAPSTWALGFKDVEFQNLRELDLRRCSIQIIPDDIFGKMPNLEALYLGENSIVHVAGRAFMGLNSLLHLDFSRNAKYEERSMGFGNFDVFRNLVNLTSLDLSMTQLNPQDVNVLWGLSPNLTRLSICSTGLNMLPNRIFWDTTLRFLDVSGNYGILSGKKPLEGLENTVEVIYANNAGVKTLQVFQKLKKLEILNLVGNELVSVSRSLRDSWRHLKVFNVDENRITSWFLYIFNSMTNLQFLSMRDNNINLVSKEMLEDFKNISYIGLSGNFIVCNCHSRELFELAYRNQGKKDQRPLVKPSLGKFAFHTATNDFNNLVVQGRELTRNCKKKGCESDDFDYLEGNFRLFDYDLDSYRCLQVTEAKSIPFYDVISCSQLDREREVNVIDERFQSLNLLYLLLILPLLILPVLVFCYVFRRNLKYFCVTMRNSATLSLLNNHVVDDGTIFNYDVFVSYCNNDRNWVLDHLLPHVEKDCSVSVCLHERDFQVGLSILENIVSCMDRSRYIMLVISQQFLLSQWCQFEMHLAQHRLLETRREDLILVLLEDIPRRMRPTTLHYLMLTKTYIVWPKQASEEPAFWRRLKRSLLAHRVKSQENSISLA